MKNSLPKFSRAIVLASTLLAFGHAQAGHHEGDKKMAKESHKMMKQDIVDTAVAAGSFNTLAAALTEAGLIDTLKGDGPFTVFAPTDDAFAKIPADQLKAIMADKELLTSILTYHVVSGKVMASDVVKLSSATTLQGSDVTVNTDDGVMINNAKVIKTDIKTSNGVIHVIDTVLVP
ncbi:fasciclin domain-containing protein [Arenicella xantha]|uniref:Putative surface protein with fasciclin (FAS1) repeats n=1 Tax=Arenicella xantha TaxID=644221 RepID=A0A395JLH2_9GAMM|nr:fasciclin domain-containing protein [Arenicella xantha]RBP51643.1 putative surface protein with fasciclin (FAS1) repeats [Arenicella xantha]